MYTLLKKCRACGSRTLTPVFNVGVQPLANDFRSDSDPHSGFYPLNVLFCEECSLAQLSVIVDPSVMYSNYHYLTSNSKTMEAHFHVLANDLKSRAGRVGSVLEIGSNDGTLLRFLNGKNFSPIMGVEPATNLSRVALNSGIPTTPEFFNLKTATALRAMDGEYDFIIARHVFCHIPDWMDCVEAISQLCHDDTLVYIEAPYARSTLKGLEFDQIYHEHMSFMSLRPMNRILNRFNLYIQDVVEYGIHGGTIGLFVGRKPPVAGFTDSITAKDWLAFSDTIRSSVIPSMVSLVYDLTKEGKTICGYGASAKSTVWINSCGWTDKSIKFVTDTTPSKWDKMIPGTSIPVVDPGALMRELPSYAILFSWNYAKEIIEKEKLFRESGGKFIIPHTCEII